MAQRTSTHSRATQKRHRSIWINLLTAVLAIVWILPIVWIVLTSFRAEGGAFVQYFVPKSYTFQNYVTLFNNPDFPFLQWFLNTLMVSEIGRAHV